MDLVEVETLAKRLMVRHGVPASWRFAYEYEERADAVCHHALNCITLCPTVVERQNHYEVVADILHEIAHCLVGPGHGHDAVWHNKLVELIRAQVWGK